MAAVTTTAFMDITGLGSRMKVYVRQEKGREGDECKIYVYRWNCPFRAQHTISLVFVERAIEGVSWHDVTSGRSDLNPAAWRAVDPSSARAQISTPGE